jgi:hypothetical protein
MFAEGFSGLKAFFFRSRAMKLFSVWVAFILFLIFLWIVGENSNDKAVGVSALVCGGSTFLFWNYRKRLSTLCNLPVSTRKKFVFVSSLGAVWAEFVFWFFEKVFSAHGVAASSNLGLDLLITMPWYIIMGFLLFRVETTYCYSSTEILLLGGIYELGADGIFGQILEGLTAEGLLLVGMVTPLFVMVYSIIVLPPTYLFRREIALLRREEGTHKYRYGLLPLLGLIPYSVYIGLFMMAAFVFALT